MINKVKVFKALKGTLNPTRVGHKVEWKSIDPETSPLKDVTVGFKGLIE